MGSQVDITTCTDACTHSNQGLLPEVGWLVHTHCATQGNPCFYVTMQRVLSHNGESGRHKYMHNTHSKQAVGTEMGDIHTNSATHRYPCFHATMLRAWSWHRDSHGHIYMYWYM